MQELLYKEGEKGKHKEKEKNQMALTCPQKAKAAGGFYHDKKQAVVPARCA
jgi:hypothetical protein